MRKNGDILAAGHQKPLVRSLILRPISEAPLQKKPMTLIVGIVCREVIVLAAESQFTDPFTGSVDYGDKISTIPLYYGEFLVAQAGRPDVTTSVVDILKEKSKNIQEVNAAVIKRIVSDSIHELKTEFLDKEQIRECKENGGAALLVAFYSEKERELHLNKVDVLGSGLTTPPENKHYSAIGVGSWLADYLFSESHDPASDVNVAAATAIYVIQKVKSYQRGTCGGQTKVALMGRISQPSLDAGYIGKSISYDEKFVELMEKEFAARDLQNKIEHRKHTIEMIHSVSKRVLEERQKNKNAG